MGQAEGCSGLARDLYGFRTKEKGPKKTPMVRGKADKSGDLKAQRIQEITYYVQRNSYRKTLARNDFSCNDTRQRRCRSFPLKSQTFLKVLIMSTPHMTERMLTVCALIAEEKDPVKFLVLVRELNDMFSESVKVEHARSTTALRTARVRNISQQA